MKKFILISLIIISMVSLVACSNETAVSGEIKTYELTSDIDSLDIQIKAADFTIEEGDEFSVESNLKNISVSEKNGVLTIVDESRRSVGYNSAMLKLCIPKGITFKDADIATGAGKVTVDTISADSFELNTGAGNVEFEHLEALTDIDINDGTLNNLTVDLGVGKLEMTAALLGENDLRFGVGESDLTLIGDKDDYNFDVVNGIGKITIDDKSASLFANSGNGETLVKIKGGVGATDIKFQ